MKIKITLSNLGGELDTTTVEVPAIGVYNEDTPIKDALNRMIAGIDLNTGDTITITEIE